ncbi:MAG: RNA polymerase sigma factor [Pyrinomonadaceae bacterium]|nr:RNA polymerase sigma factor [Pyrinomonadaceae bacterium]MCX7640722.1 RNA polymerase sigma factor [Pyrinomonadaceae bacterium]MDW8305310.1 RNA polymerase sigma factor [Acidobacteriota bacterium]
MQNASIIVVRKTERERLLKSYEQLSDDELTVRSCAGDEDAFAEIVRRYTPRVFMFVGKFFRQRSVIEEVAQEVFLRVYVQLKSYAHKGSFEGWLTRVTVNTCINHLRSKKEGIELTASSSSEEEEFNWIEKKLNDASLENSDEDRLVASDLVNKVLGKMSAEERIILTLIDAEGHSIKEVARMMNWSEAKVKIKAFRARRKMREAIEKLLRKRGNQGYAK